MESRSNTDFVEHNRTRRASDVGILTPHPNI
jgi:hypothetical protein